MESKYTRIQMLLEFLVSKWKCREIIRELSRDRVKEHVTVWKTGTDFLNISKARELGLEYITDRELSLKVFEQKG